ncbi:MAG: hypothetical protein JHC87_01865 [Thermoleophilaceae bacterium]|nr:hypothetical protein [Thermoleophilaceae bacterium]
MLGEIDFGGDMQLTASHARTRSILLVVLVALSGALALAPSASARKLATGVVRSAAVNGTNVYWVSSTRSGLTSVNRIDLATGAVTTIFTMPGGNSFVEDVRSGGGRVAFDVFTVSRTHYSSTIKVAALDGSGLSDLATGDFSYKNDCGQANELIDVSSTGEVFASSLARKHSDVTCGGGADSDTSAVTGYPAAAGARLVFQRVGPAGREVADSMFFRGQVRADNLLLLGTSTATAIDLTNNAQATYTRLLTGSTFLSGSVDASGKVLLGEAIIHRKKVKLKKKKGKKQKYKIVITGRSKLMSYAGRLNPASGTSLFDSKKEIAVAEYCGARIARGTGLFSDDGYFSDVVEIDAAGNALRGLTPSLDFLPDGLRSCDATNLILSGYNFKTRKDELQLVPLS